ncbi:MULTISPECIES: fumarylacetoacetate hydrolase family protein [Paraburkholderia]|uniref:Fumarylacetoacetate hydrolase family protein n=1 Tax=Paraburkholderia madseniana TaxID=2599607 RepID=A0AAP5BJ63_9BURK|nr:MULTISPECIES: fumarylacetoacetate hydrolase family protein [Paraburkholderia]MCX4149958.1 fumarylacetoacetate hydrolase family protein [Paraburkholderia madseniana]MDN7152894.1 fumarylacetoacetate hydrolase family protein [Paraburkholderia sp. WS6]MDQ6411776.1 fumarylacetoacetate hydrolase family protein [Paraburkholderia madseniana]
MRLVSYSTDGDALLGIVDGETVTSLTGRIAGLPTDMTGLIAEWEHFGESIRQLPRSPDYKLSEVNLLAPIARPGKIYCIGLNYPTHLAEATDHGVEAPMHQVWFSKPATAVAGPYEPIKRPIVSIELDYEAELVFVIGKRCRHVPAERASDVIFGYCVGNDVSVRDWQLRSGQYTIGKSFDTHAPFGPWIVTADEVDPKDLGIRSFLNGERRQAANTGRMIFDCAAQVAHLSQAMTLEPGDVIFTGTPGGVGIAMNPPQYMKAGDRIRVEIDGIGFIENEVVDEVSGTTWDEKK